MNSCSSPSIFRKVYEFLYFKSWSLGLWETPDRRFLTEEIFTHFAEDPRARKILFVGVRNYTRSYERYFDKKIFITLDNDPSVQTFGARRHYTGDVCKFSEETQFDVIFLNGVIGFGLDQDEQIVQALKNIRALAKPNAWVILGTNGLPMSSRVSETLKRELRATDFPRTGRASHLFKMPLSSGQHEFKFYMTSAGTAVQEMPFGT